MRNDLKTNGLKTLKDLEVLVREVYKYGRCPITQVELRGLSDSIRATLAWIGLTRGRDVELLRTLIPRVPLVDAQRGKAGAIYAKEVAEGRYEFTDNDGFDQLKATLYYVLVRQLRKHP